MRAPLVLLLALLALPSAAACSYGPPPDYQVLVATGDGAVWGNDDWSIGERWLVNGSFRHVTYVPIGGRWDVSPDARWLAVHRSEPGVMCDRVNHTLEVRDLRTNRTRTLLQGFPGVFAASERHLALARPDGDAIEVVAWETGAVVRNLTVDPLSPEGFAFDWYGPPWRANETNHLAWSPDGRRLASQGGPSRWLVVWDAENGGLVRPGKPPYGIPNGDPLVGLAFSPDGRWLAGLTTQHDRFSEVFTWDLAAEDNQMVGVRRFVEAGTGLLWTDEGLVVAFEERHWQSGSAASGVLRRFPAPNLTGEVEARFADGRAGPGLDAHGGLLHVAAHDGLRTLDLRTLRAPEAPLGGGGAPSTTPPPTTDEPPIPDERRPAPLPAALTLLGILAAWRACRGGTRRP